MSQAPVRTRELDMPPGPFVYFVTASGFRDYPVKIGYAADPDMRIAELQCGNPHRLYRPALIIGDRTTEAILHRHWRDHALVRGEWFGKGYRDAIIATGKELVFRQGHAERAGATRDQIMRDVVTDTLQELGGLTR